MVSVSIITPAYNSAQFIEETIKSVINQSFSEWELIVVDDCSCDNSIELIQNFIDKDSRIKLIRLSINSGAAVARNKAIKLAKGRYIAFLDSDDIWHTDKLCKQLCFMKENNYSFTYSAYEKIDQFGNLISHESINNKVSYIDLLKTCSIGCLTVIYDTAYFGKVYMPLIKRRQDYGLWLTLLKKTDFAYGLNKTLAYHRIHSNSISFKKRKVLLYQWIVYRKLERLNMIESLYFFSNYAFYGVKNLTSLKKFKKLF